MGVDEMGVDEMGVDKMGSCLSGNKPMAVFSLMIAFIVLVGGINCFFLLNFIDFDVCICRIIPTSLFLKMGRHHSQYHRSPIYKQMDMSHKMMW